MYRSAPLLLPNDIQCGLWVVSVVIIADDDIFKELVSYNLGCCYVSIRLKYFGSVYELKSSR
jgi:hypothetical protein